LRQERKEVAMALKRINLPSAYWYEIWSQFIARAWSALRDLEKLQDKADLAWLHRQEAEHLKKLAGQAQISPEVIAFLLDIPSTPGEEGRKELTWDLLVRCGFVAGKKPLNFPNLFVELVDDDGKDGARYMVKNAYRNINGWAQDLVELGGQATIKVPEAPPEKDRARMLDWYIKQGLHMPFAPNNQAPFAPGNAGVTPSTAIGFAGNRVGEESASEALDCDAEWFGVFPQIMASAWHLADHCERLTQRRAKEAKKEVGKLRHDDPLRARMARERDALFAEFGYRRPIGLDVDFELVLAPNYSVEEGWLDERLKPTLVIRIPPPPRDLHLHPIALADYRSTGKAQLFTT
jgi:hypothetical protein